MTQERTTALINTTRDYIEKTIADLKAIAQPDDPDSCHQAMQAMSDLKDELAGAYENLDDAFIAIDDIGADCNAWDEEENDDE